MATAAPFWGQHSAGLANYQQRLKNSALYQQTINAGGQLNQTMTVDATKLFTDMAPMMAKSDEVLLLHILSNSSQLSPSGQAPITVYKAEILQTLKGRTYGTVTFSVPFGMVAFDSKTHAYTRIPNFHPFRNGGRYMVCLHFSQGTERQLTPGYRLTGYGVQGGFRLKAEKVYPLYSGDQLTPEYKGMAVPQFLTSVRALLPAH
ncbi:MAG: hypothetical protein WCG81_22155, partial [Candidatus Angelobacter sp.]